MVFAIVRLAVKYSTFVLLLNFLLNSADGKLLPHHRKYLSVGSYVNQHLVQKQNTLTFKLIRPTLLFYVVAAATIYILEKISPSGPCSPGLGVLSFFLLIPIAVGLLLLNIYLTIKVDKENLINVFIHAAAIILLFIIMW